MMPPEMLDTQAHVIARLRHFIDELAGEVDALGVEAQLSFWSSSGPAFFPVVGLSAVHRQ